MQSPDNVCSADSLTPAHLDDSTDIGEHPLKEVAEVQASLLVDARGDTLHAAAAGEATDVGLGDALDVVAEDFPESQVSVVLMRFDCEEWLHCSPMAFSAADFACTKAAVA